MIDQNTGRLFGFQPGNIIDVGNAHPVGNDTGSAYIVKILQPWNAQCPIVVTLLGMVIEIEPVQYQKAASPIVVTLFGMVNEVKPWQPMNAQSPIAVTLFGIILLFVPAINVLS
jgi:hypothetical protein